MTSKMLSAYAGKKVLITGHTGFKGSWLSAWLLKTGARAVGYSKDLPTEPAMFDVTGLSKQMTHVIGDVRDAVKLSDVIRREKPDFVFHLAAQAIVSTSYADPGETITTNAIGTMNVLEALRGVDWPCMAVLITSDKCYDNVEWVWGYKETDKLGGKDVYSGSKAAAELVIRCYLASFFDGGKSPVRVGVARAGNVVGGGDWAKDRIIADCVRAWSDGKAVEIRSPNATRPWQHVLEPLSGYLVLGAALKERQDLHGEAFNFGPRAEQNNTVLEMITELAQLWDAKKAESLVRVVANTPFYEAGLLKLNCDKALFHLKWEPTLFYPEPIKMIRDWYHGFYHGGADMYRLTLDQIAAYEAIATERRKVWAV